MIKHMYDDSGLSWLTQLYLFIIAGILAAATLFWRDFSLGRFFTKGIGRQLPDSDVSSAILSFYTAGNRLERLAEGTRNNMHFASYVTTPSALGIAPYVADFAGIHILELPFNAGVHLIGLSKQHTADRIKFGNFIQGNGMERVVLEGDFSDYFDLYAAKGEQVNAREVLEPDAMQHVINYCSSHFWEINQDEMYIVTSSADKTTHNIFDEAQRFVEEIKPALKPGRPGARTVHHHVPYGQHDGPPLPCPICKQTMPNNNLWHTCPQGHGILINGRELMGLRSGTVSITADASKATKHGELSCPNCSNPMVLVDYQDSGIEINSCEHCPYRWLDANEIIELASGKKLAQF